jgi:hypothetical protein
MDLDVPPPQCQYQDNASKSVVSLCALGLMDGGKALFQGDARITRAEFTKMLIIATHENAEIEETGKRVVLANQYSFPDVKPNAWFAKYIAVAKEFNDVHGYPNSKTFVPWNTVRMSEALKIIFNTASDTNAKIMEDLKAARLEVRRTFLEQYANAWFMPYAFLADQYGAVFFEPNQDPGDQYSEELTRQKAADLVYAIIQNAGIEPKSKLSKLKQQLTLLESVGKL